MERLVVFSDSHGDFSSLMMAAEQQLGKGKLFLFCGDGRRDWEDLEDLYPHLNMLAVRGNCDFASMDPSLRLLEFAGRRVMVTHGHDYHVKSTLSLLQQAAKEHHADLVLFGHTHTAEAFCEDGIWYVNPGSLGAPRSGEKTYAYVNFFDDLIMPVIVPAWPKRV